MPLDERNVPLPPDDDGNEDVLTSQSRNPPPPNQGSGDSPLPQTRQDGKTSWRLIRETAGRRGNGPVTSRSRRAGYISRSAI
jgi:hypothetical protein